MKRKFFTESAYICGILALAFGTALMEKADLGLSMVVAPAYLLYRKLSLSWSFVSFGMAEYLLQALLLLLLTLVLRRFRPYFLFSFVTAVVYGFTLDGAMALIAPLGCSSLAVRIVFFLLGFALAALGVAFMFQTYIAPEVYELFVKELSADRNWDINRVKTVYDCVSCLVAILLSFLFFGPFHFEGVKLGTVFCALLNGRLIGLYSRLMNKRWSFQDQLPLRKYFS